MKTNEQTNVGAEFRTDTETLIGAMKILSEDIESKDGVVNAAIFEAAERLEELHEALEWLVQETNQIAYMGLVEERRRASRKRYLYPTMSTQIHQLIEWPFVALPLVCAIYFTLGNIEP